MEGLTNNINVENNEGGVNINSGDGNQQIVDGADNYIAEDDAGTVRFRVLAGCIAIVLGAIVSAVATYYQQQHSQIETTPPSQSSPPAHRTPDSATLD